MRFQKILEKGWQAAIFIAFGMGLINLVIQRRLIYSVYTPFICGGFCILIYMNIRGQRRFLEKMKADKDKGNEEAIANGKPGE